MGCRIQSFYEKGPDLPKHSNTSAFTFHRDSTGTAQTRKETSYLFHSSPQDPLANQRGFGTHRFLPDLDSYLLPLGQTPLQKHKRRRMGTLRMGRGRGKSL
jgi:hypothetical protein